MPYLRSLLVIFSVAVLISLPKLGTAQVSTASITGTITDTTGASIPDAMVTLKSDATGIARTSQSNQNGLYSFDFVPIGAYTVTTVRTGFQGQSQHFQLAAAQIARGDFSMGIAKTQDVVEVTAEMPLLNTTSSEQVSTLNESALNQLPVARQDWTSVLQLGPGISTAVVGGGQAGASLSLNGLPPSGFNLTVDGTNATSNPELPAFGFYQGPNIINTINNDSIAEVVIVKGVAPATIGGTMSGNVNIVTKSGGNIFHGSLYEINEVSAFDARNQFLTARPRSTFNEFGGSFGGPILSSKLFFFASYGGARVSGATAVSGAVPTPYLISQSPAVYASLFKAYPTVAQPSDPTAITVQSSRAGSVRQTDSNGAVRVDYNIDNNNLLYGRYIRSRPEKTGANITLINARKTTGASDATNLGFTHSGRSFTSLTRFGYNRVHLTRLDQGFGSDLEQVIVEGLNSGGAEQFIIAGGFYTLDESVSLIRGKHSFIIGGVVERQNTGRTDFNTAKVQFPSRQAFFSNSPSLVQITFDLNPFNLSAYQYGGFLQDNYKVSSNLTLNLGIRYDYYTVPQEDSGRIFNRGVDPANSQLGPGFGPYRPANSMFRSDRNNVQPRVGLAWNPGSRGTVVRAGFGVFVGPHPIFGGPIDLVQDSASQPFRIILNATQTAQAGLTYPLPRSTFPDVLAKLQSSGTISKDFANTTINPNFPDPYSMQWMAGVAQNLPGNVVFEMDYVGNHGLKENMTEALNLPNRLTGVAPKPAYSQFRYYYGGDSSSYNGLQVTLNKGLSHGFSFGGSYVWSKVMSYGQANLILQSEPQDNNNIRAEYGPAPFDLRNKFVGRALWMLPLNRWTHTDNRVGRLLLGGWQLSTIFTGQSGMPLNILNGSSSYPSDRPDPGTGSTYLADYHKTRKYLNPAGFSQVPISPLSKAQIRGGYLGRNAVLQPGRINVDATIGKTFSFYHGIKLQLKADTFNTFNHTNLSGLTTNISSGSFGQLSSATARTMQLTGRITF
jgi:outer membrane receptor protein involved in Fe transport